MKFFLIFLICVVGLPVVGALLVALAAMPLALLSDLISTPKRFPRVKPFSDISDQVTALLFWFKSKFKRRKTASLSALSRNFVERKEEQWRRELYQELEIRKKGGS